jgi:hypothetical protein
MDGRDEPGLVRPNCPARMQNYDGKNRYREIKIEMGTKMEIDTNKGV